MINNYCKIAIAILNWNGAKYLEKYLPSVIQHSQLPDTKIFVIDNNSTDNSIELLNNSFPKINIILLDKNYGFSEGYNRGLQQIKASFFLLLNSDIEVTHGWLLPLIQTLENEEKAGVCMPKILSIANRSAFEYAGAAGGFIDKYGYPFCRGRILAEIEEDSGQYDSLKEIFWASGACMLVKAELYNKLGGLDNDFFAHMEEIDLCWRIKNHGYKIYCNPQSIVYHVGGGTLPNNNPRKLFLNYRNNLFLILKNLQRKKLIKVLIIRMLLDIASAMVYFLRFSFSSFFVVIRAHLAFLLSIKKIYHKRHFFKKYRLLNSKTGVLDKSILFCYFIKKQKKYSHLEF